MVDIFEPKTVEEFIDYYENELKKELSVYDVQINKIGFLGFLLNILGHTHYDIKNYYDFLFKESFIATSETSENIHLHASTYGYFPSFGIPAQVNGYLEVDFNILPAKLPTVTKRELYINNYGDLFKFDSENYEFITQTVYKLVYENNQYKTIVLTEDGRSIQYPSSTAILTPPILDATQYTQVEYIFKTSLYPANSFYTYYFEVEEGYISDLKVFVIENNKNEEEEYEVKYVKYFETASSKTVFLRKISQTRYVIELGSGLRGKWLPQADIRLVLNITKGESGNFLKLSKAQQKSPEQVVLVDYDSNNNVVTTLNLSANQIVILNIESSENGKNPLNDLDMREDVIKYIQTRDNMMSEIDFYNIADKYMSDFKFLFKKIQVFDNIFYLCRSMRDKYQSVLYTTNHTLEESLFTDMCYPEFTVNGVDMISPFFYKYNDIMNYYDGYLLYDDLFVYINSIVLSDDIIPTYNVPPLYFNLIYNESLNQTKIQVKSYQDISMLDFQLFIPILNIYDESMLMIDVNTFEYIYTDNSGIIFDEIDIQIESYESSVKIFTATVESIFQIYNITDLLNLIHYENFGTNYIINIPIIEKDKFNDDKKYFLQKLNDFIMGNSFNENRMISDHIQFRFLNSYLITSPFLESSLIQGQNVLAKINRWLNPVNTKVNVPVVLPEHGDRFLIDTSPVGLFSGKANQIAEWIEVCEETEIICNEASTLSGSEYFLISSITTNYYVWYNIDGMSADPAPIGLTGIVINILSTDTNVSVADKTSSALNILPDFNSSFVANVINITNYIAGDVTNSNDFNTNFSLSTLVEGITGHYEYEIPEEFDGILISDEPARYSFESNAWIIIEIELPLNLRVEIIIEQQYLNEKNINLYEEKEQLIYKLADYLQKNYTGTNILYYDSQIIDFVHLERPFIKSVKITTTDKNGLIIPNGIEVNEDRLILENLKENKFNIVKYTPIFWHWDLDNIEVITLIQ